MNVVHNILNSDIIGGSKVLQLNTKLAMVA